MSGLELLIPLGFVALVAIPLVIILHMRHAPPQPRPVPTLRFWAISLQEQTDRTRLRRPPITLLLLLHVLIVGLLATALSRPVTAEAWANLGLRGDPVHLILLLDGSTSMLATDTTNGETRFEQAKDTALDEVEDLGEGDVVTVVLMGTRFVTFEATDSGSLTALRQRLASLTPPGGRADLDAALNLSRNLFLPDLRDQIVVISDGALTVDPTLVGDLGAPVQPITVGGVPRDQVFDGNVAVTDIAARARTGSTESELYVKITNFSFLSVAVPLVLQADGIELSRREAELGPTQSLELSWSIPASSRVVDVALDINDPLPGDNRASLVLRQSDELGLTILLVSDTPGSLSKALGVLPGVRLTAVPSNDPKANDSGSAYDLVVYEGVAPPERLPDAAIVFVHPPPGTPFSTGTTMPAPKIVGVAADDPLLTGVDLAGVTFGETTGYVLNEGATSIVSGDNGPLIARGTIVGNPYVLLAFDIEASNLRQRVAFPILIANIADQLVPSPLPQAVALGDPLVYRPSAGAATVTITPPGQSPLELPVAVPGSEAAEEGLRTLSFPDTGLAGRYLVQEHGPGGEELGGGEFVVNAGHLSESDLRANPDLNAILATATGGGGGSRGENVIDLWPVAVAAALLLLVLEWLVSVMPRRRARSAATLPLVGVRR